MGAFLATSGHRLGTDVVAVLEQFAASAQHKDDVWCEEVGRLSSVPEGSDHAVLAAAQLALRVSAGGGALAWEAQLPWESSLSLRSCVLPRATSVRVSGGAEGMLVELSRADDGYTRATFALEGGLQNARVVPSDAAHAAPQVALRGGGSIVLWPAGRATEVPALGAFTERAPVVERVNQDIVACFLASLEIIDTCAPCFAPWVAEVIRDVLVLRPLANRILSASNSDAPGMVSLSVAPPLAVAEMLVHEASHQWLHLVMRVGPLVDPADDRLYYSPAKGTMRPLLGILAAWHAFGNMDQLFRQVAESGQDDGGFLALAMPKVRAQLEGLRPSLDDNPALTPLGRALYLPLREALDA